MKHGEYVNKVYCGLGTAEDDSVITRFNQHDQEAKCSVGVRAVIKDGYWMKILIA